MESPRVQCSRLPLTSSSLEWFCLLWAFAIQGFSHTHGQKLAQLLFLFVPAHSDFHGFSWFSFPKKKNRPGKFKLSLNAMTLNRHTKNKRLASVNASLMLMIMNVAFPWIASFILCHKVVEGLRLVMLDFELKDLGSGPILYPLSP